MEVDSLRAEFLVLVDRYFALQRARNTKTLNQITITMNQTTDLWNKDELISEILTPLLEVSSSEVKFLAASYLLRYFYDCNAIQALKILCGDADPHIAIFSPIILDLYTPKP